MQPPYMKQNVSNTANLLPSSYYDQSQTFYKRKGHLKDKTAAKAKSHLPQPNSPCQPPPSAQQTENKSVIDDIMKEEEGSKGKLVRQGKKYMSKEQLREKLAIVQHFIEEKGTRQPKSDISGPSKEELDLCLQRLCKQFPSHDVGFIISRLHQHLSHQCSKDGASALKISSDSDQIVIDNCFTPAVLRSNDEKRIAISFLNYGYGLKVLREVIKDEAISPTKYNNIITTIMKNTFRTIESTIKQLDKPTVPVGPHEERILRAPLVNSEKWLPNDQLHTFYHFVRGATGLDQVHISSDLTCKLYHSIIRQLHQRETAERPSREPNKQATVTLPPSKHESSANDSH